MSEYLVTLVDRNGKNPILVTVEAANKDAAKQMLAQRRNRTVLSMVKM